VDALKNQGPPSANLLLNELARRRAALQGRGVNSAVLADIAAFERGLAAPR